MKLLRLIAFLLSCLSSSVFAQDFSNKGKDFWVAYGYHQVMSGNNAQEMVLYFATDGLTTVNVEIPALGYSRTYSNIPANTIFTSEALPKSGSQDARLLSEGIYSSGIHITSTRPIVAYTHIYNQSVSGATLLFPTATLGKDYFSVNYEQVSNTDYANCWVYAVAVDTGITTVEIVPSQNTLTHPAGIPFTVTLRQGQVINLMGELALGSSPYRGVDLTGTSIKSTGTGTGGCKKIAVFSGSGRISLSCNGTAPSSDNYIVQAFPRNAWGKKYLTAPTRTLPRNFFRVCVQDPTTVVKVNGTPLTGLVDNFYYQFSSDQPSLIESNKPVMVSQVVTSQGACGNGNPGDPEVIYLSPVEQNIDRVILNSTSQFAISQHWINVVIKSAGANSFALDGTPFTAFSPHPADANYSYAQISVGAGQHSIRSDSGFNAIAYGFGIAESYGYNAGTNVRDLYQFVSIQNQYSAVNFPATCRNTPFVFSMTFPYQPTQISWVFGPALNGMGVNDTVMASPVFDSTWTVNDRQLYRYKLPRTYNISAVGTYPIKIIAQNPTSDGCNGEQEITYDLEVFETPDADFTFTSTGCASDSVRFFDASPSLSRPPIRWNWAFGDGGTSQVNNPAHLFTTPGSYNVKYSLITDIGCVSDTAQKTVAISDPPEARFAAAAPFCAGNTVSFADQSTTTSGVIAKWTWNFGDGTPVVTAATGVTQAHTYAVAGNYTVTLQVENASGCKSTVFSQTIAVTPVPVAAFTFGSGCLPLANVAFTNASTISDGSQATLVYGWAFGDGSTSTAQNPSHTFTAPGPFNVSLRVTSAAGCADTTELEVTTIYPQPQAAFTAPAEICLGSPAAFTDGSSVPGGAVSSWSWDFGDGSSSTQQSPTHIYMSSGNFTVSLLVRSNNNCSSVAFTKQIIVNALPTADFNLAAPACTGASVSFVDASQANSGTINNWSWNFGDGSPVSTQQSPAHTYATTGTYTATLQVKTDKGCSSTVHQEQVIVNSLPVVGFKLPDNCLNDPVSLFTDTSRIADGTESQFTYVWNFNDPNATPGNPNTSTAKNGLHRYTAARSYSVSLTVTSNNGCISTASQNFTINGAVPNSSFTVRNGLQHCSNDSIFVTDNSTVDFGRLVKLEIYWDYTGDPTNRTVVTGPLAGTIYSRFYPQFFTPATKTVTVRVVAYSGDNCLHTSDQLITLKARPDILFPAIASVCADEPSFRLPASVSNLTGGTGLFTGTAVSGSGLFSPAVAGAGRHVVTYTYTAANGCTSSQTQTATVFAVPAVSAGVDRAVLEGGSAVLAATASGNGLRYLWTPSTYLNNPAVLRPQATPAADISYTLTVTSADGCSNFDQVSVKILKNIQIPNAFTPNGDGINDRWVIEYLESYPGAVVEIFNRYGSLVFRSVGYPTPWDGTFKGSAMPAGTYYYIINPKNGRVPITGFVDIVR